MDANYISTDCPICEINFESPRYLPCGETICINCITRATRRGQLDCPVCRTIHAVPSTGFPKNKQLERVIGQIVNRLSRGAYGEVKKLLEDAEVKLKSYMNDFDSSQQIINSYCDTVNQQLNVSAEKLLQEVDAKKETIRNEIAAFGERNSNDLYRRIGELHSRVIQESRKKLDVLKREMRNYRLDENGLRVKLSRAKQLNWTLNTYKRRFKNAILNHKELFVKGKVDLKLHEKDLSTIDLEDYTTIRLDSFIDCMPDYDVSFDVMDSGLFIVNYMSMKKGKCALEQRDFSNPNKAHLRITIPPPINFLYQLFSTKNDMTVYLQVTDTNTFLYTFDKKFNNIKRKSMNYKLSMVAATDHRILATYSARNSQNAHFACHLILFDWDLNVLMTIDPNHTQYPFTMELRAIYSNNDYFFLDDAAGICQVDAKTGVPYQILNDYGTFKLVDANSIAFYDGTQLVYFDFNLEIAQAISLRNFVPANMKILANNKRQFLFYNQANRTLIYSRD
ncbi:unnamed protein product [Brachionus calyciflorus]|uniref:RING-type domain-containing protein n=1 Tax=Brachionus calyciflorus TaxID=104777 RepID=A0A813W1J4_9BILA|nr:unnamed protein product [Brachionus calyciflorus]